MLTFQHLCVKAPLLKLQHLQRWRISYMRKETSDIVGWLMRKWLGNNAAACKKTDSFPTKSHFCVRAKATCFAVELTISAIARHFYYSFVICFFTVYEHWLCSIQPIAETLKVSLAKWQNPCYNIYISFRIATEQLQWMSNTVPEDERLQALFCFFCLSQTEAQTGRRGVCPLPADNFISGILGSKSA